MTDQLFPLTLPGDYRPAGLFRWCHFNTIYPTLLRNVPLENGHSLQLTTPDNDFFDVDMFTQGFQRTAVLLHGLEGNARSTYIRGLTHYLLADGWDVAAMNFRGCSGMINRTARSYHSGFTEDITLLIDHLAESYRHIVLVGFSLGGSIVLNYLGQTGNRIPTAVRAGAVISTPLDLSASGRELERLRNRIYVWRFLASMKRKVAAKAQASLLPEDLDLNRIQKAKSIREFDEYFTAPVHGFRNAADYYQRCSARQCLSHITLPLLILNARDDPFLSDRCYPQPISPPVQCLYPAKGGHVGFARWGNQPYWSETIIGAFLSRSMDRIP
ncbi:MAG: YheT family hydrolase [Fidelibacterota bacterium]